MNNRQQPDRHNMKIKLASNKTVHQLISQGGLKPIKPADERAYAIKGINGAIRFCLAADAHIEIISDEEVHINGQSIKADVFALPAPAYRAVVQVNPFTQYVGIDEALGALQQVERPQIATQMIKELVREGRRPDTTARLATLSQQFSSVWLPEKTLVQIKPITSEKQYPGGPTELIFLTLVFKTVFHNVWRAPARIAMGIDVGWDPHTVVACEDGQVTQFMLTPTLSINRLCEEASALQAILHYASGRCDGERAIGYLIGNAHSIYSEALNHTGMRRHYITNSRNRALQDTSFSHLSQYANAANIPFIRVDARYTSQTCPQCQNVDAANRTRHRFHCIECGYTGNAHEVAAKNVLSRGVDPSADHHCTGQAAKNK
ncbi:zinc ribbon domain-containing protein [Deinococcus sp. A31D244]|uniref:zinc ribbon domain-containing protein n=1 Tax=Deinococcus sp. A31D244 TaxID=3397675 RepID=UPI0039E17C2A